MDQHGICRDRREARANRVRPVQATNDQFTNLDAGKARRGIFLLSFADHDPGPSDCRMTDERLDCPSQHRLAADLSELLGDSSAQALALAGGHNEGGDSHEGRALRVIALSAKGSSTISRRPMSP